MPSARREEKRRGRGKSTSSPSPSALPSPTACPAESAFRIDIWAVFACSLRLLTTCCTRAEEGEGESEEGGGVDQLKWASPTGDYHWLVSHNLWGVCLPIALYAIFVVFANWPRGT